MSTRTRTVYTTTCDGCGAVQPDDLEDRWIEIVEAYIPLHNGLSYLGGENGSKDFCSTACMAKWFEDQINPPPPPPPTPLPPEHQLGEGDIAVVLGPRRKDGSRITHAVKEYGWRVKTWCGVQRNVEHESVQHRWKDSEELWVTTCQQCCRLGPEDLFYLEPQVP